MLVLKLCPGQTLWVGSDVQVTVLGNSQEFVRVGVQTRQFQEIKIDEDELWGKGQADETQ